MLPPLIEYLFSQEAPSGGRFCHPAPVSGIGVAPANFVISFQLSPIAYMAIEYATIFQCLPNAFYVEVMQAGNNYFIGTITPEQIGLVIGYWVVFTRDKPIEFRVTNLTAMNQVWSFTQFQLAVENEEDYKALRQHIWNYSTVETNRLSKEMVDLLTKIESVLKP